ncbi:protein of unknown function; putative exported protein [Methylorubrum extorquens DM4]|uniref:Uncharacterized protein n=1 Tax=Methylorubrum extorquens (strain DSM 6343 / CIP 106787 / DM4) TaxID=661410 RepID=C7CHA6_METED|nr:protein of unknown function; putative exported protein [Methylorubrum extorquens DM4]
MKVSVRSSTMKTLQARLIALAVILGGASAAPPTLAQTASSPAVNNWAELRAVLEPFPLT